MWLLYTSYVTSRGMNKSPENVLSALGTHADEPQVELRDVYNKQNTKQPDDNIVPINYSIRSVFMLQQECCDLGKGHHVRGAVCASLR